jgi:hypothetical protein
LFAARVVANRQRVAAMPVGLIFFHGIYEDVLP